MLKNIKLIMQIEFIEMFLCLFLRRIFDF